MAEHVPPGRARRLWLVERIEGARRSLDLLDRKRQVLGAARDSLAQRAAAAAVEAERSWAAARSAAYRSAAVGGALQEQAAAEPLAATAVAGIGWTATAGVRHPDAVHCELPAIPPLRAASVSAAVTLSASAHRRALEALAAHAAARTAHRLVDAELRATERRHRAIDHHRIPALEAELAALELRLEELDREQAVTTRWVIRRSGGPAGPPAQEDGSRW